MSVTKDCMSDRIKRVLLDRICNGTYGPGERLIELQIAKEFDTSQAPIREALSQLEAMRVVETQPYKGTRVREISERELMECMQIRSVLENLAAETVEERILGRIDELRSHCADTIAAAKLGDVRAYGLANIAFHRMIVEASNNHMLLLVWDSLAPEVRMLANARASADCLIQGSHDHEEIVEAFAEGDNRFAGKLLKKHVESFLTPQIRPKQG